MAEAGVRLGHVQASGEAVLWIEGRPADGGRSVLRHWDGRGPARDLTPAPFDARTRVHEYGGGAYAVHGGGSIVAFSHFADQRLYRTSATGEPPRPITPEPPQPGADRYADARFTPDGSRLVSVRERHEASGEVVNELVELPADGSAPPSVLASGRDFYAFPRLSPDGSRLAWIEWDHPNMPWDGTELRRARWTDGSLESVELVAGGPAESIFQPEWSPGGALHFVSDRSGWWNLYSEEEGDALVPASAEFGAPSWIFGLSAYAFLPDGTIACAHGVGPQRQIGLVAPGTRRVEPVALPYGPGTMPFLHVCGTRLAYLGASDRRPSAVVLADPHGGDVEVLAVAALDELDAGSVSVPRAIEFPSEGGGSGHALLYLPAGAGTQAPSGELPPLIVESHGGPTAGADPQLDLEVQFFTSRGFAVVDVDYGGSTGYGRAYRQRLRGRWGLLDTADCLAAARHLAAQGLVDGRRMAIRGGSAGGYTTLCALTFHDLFAAGSSHYGVADAETLARDTHKFEARYLDGLIGPYPEAAGVYGARSPIHFTDRLRRPIILFQGLEDQVVPPAQAEAMVAALRRGGVPHAYLAFEGEQHGFRRAGTVRRVLEAELSFFGQIFGFEPADAVEPVEIVGLPARGAG